MVILLPLDLFFILASVIVHAYSAPDTFSSPFLKKEIALFLYDTNINSNTDSFGISKEKHCIGSTNTIEKSLDLIDMCILMD